MDNEDSVTLTRFRAAERRRRSTRLPWVAGFLRARMEEFGRKIPASRYTPSPSTWSDNAITLAWLGHATVLINFFGVRILTDPVLFPRIGVNLGLGSLGPLRQIGCALSPASLPDIDLLANSLRPDWMRTGPLTRVDIATSPSACQRDSIEVDRQAKTSSHPTIAVRP